MPEAKLHLEIIGPGRAGLALGSALRNSGILARLSYVGLRPAPPDHPLFHEAPTADYRPWNAFPGSDEATPDGVVVAVPDGSIGAVAGSLVARALPPVTPVVHLSGVLDSVVLEPLSRQGHPVGSMHPLVALPDGPAADALRGAWYGIEGDAAARDFAGRLVAALNGRSLALDAGGKARYHAAAVAASNFVVALLSVAERWMVESGIGAEEARQALAGLAAGTIESVRRLGPEGALTGPIARGDVDTVRRHLAELSAPDRLLYSVLADSTLTLARQRGLPSEVATGIARLLEPTE